MPEESLALLELIGLRPVWVDRLGRAACLVPPCQIVLLDAGLSPERLPRVVDLVAALAVDHLKQPQGHPPL